MSNELFLTIALGLLALNGLVLAIISIRRLKKTQRCLIRMKHDIKSYVMEEGKSPEPKDLVVNINKALVATGYLRPDATEGPAT